MTDRSFHPTRVRTYSSVVLFLLVLASCLAVIDLDPADVSLILEDTSPDEPVHAISDISSSSASIEGSFVVNMGQVSNDDVRFYANGDPLSIGLLEDGVLFTLKRIDEHRSVANGLGDGAIQRCAFTMRFLGCNEVTPKGVEQTSHISNYYRGNDPSSWHTGIRSFEEVHYRSLYDGVHLRFYFKDGMFKYDLEIDPGADPSQVVMEHKGVDGLSIDPRTGSLVIETPCGVVRDARPLLFPLVGAAAKGTYGDFELIGPCSVSFKVPLGIDPEDGFIIDPGLTYSTFIAGSDADFGKDVDIDDEGNVYVVGMTRSNDFPNTTGAISNSLSDVRDMVVSKLDPTLSTLLFSTYLGGNEGSWGWEEARNVVVVPGEGVYLNGWLECPNFPTTPGVVSQGPIGDYDSIITKLSFDGDLLLSTYVGGTGTESCHGLFIDEAGDVYISGTTDSPDLPTHTGAYCETRAPGRIDLDYFVMKLDSDLSDILYCTYLGGSANEFERTDFLEVAPDGTVYLVGTTESSDLLKGNNGIFPNYAGGNSDGFVCRFDGTLSNVIDSTYIGSPGEDWIEGLEVGSDNTVFISGCTFDYGYPLTQDAFDTDLQVMEATITILDGDLSRVEFSTFMGGDNREAIHALMLNPDETMIYFGGWTWSSDLPTSFGCYDPGFHGICDAMLGAINLTSHELEYLTYIGGNSWDIVDYCGIALNSDGHLVQAGNTRSPDFPVTSGAYQTDFHPNVSGSNIDIFALVLDPRPCPPPPAPQLSAIPGDGEVNLTWELEVEWCKLTGFTVYRGESPSNISEVVASTKDGGFIDAGVLNGRTYYYQASANNSAGEGVRCEPVSATPLGAPSEPTYLEAWSGDGKVHLSWSPPLGTGGGDLSGYRVYRGSTLEGDFIHHKDLGNVTTWTDPDVVLGRIYYYKVLAFNIRNYGPLSDPVQVKASAPPTSPRSLTLNPGDGRVDLEWEEPSSTGGSPLIGYRIHRGWENDSLMVIGIVLPTQTRYTDDTVVNGVQYFYQVSTFTPVGNSTPTEVLPTIPWGPPSRPTNLRTDSQDGAVLLSWEYPELEEFVGEIRFNVHAGTSEDDLTPIMTIIEDTQFLHSGLTNGQTWYYQVTAHTDYGDGPPTDIVNGTPLGRTGAPESLAAAPGDRRVDLTWDEPSDTGGSSVMTYRLYRGEVPDGLQWLQDIVGSATVFTDDTVSNGVTYHYAVSAVTITGEGPRSGQVSVTPSGPPSEPQGFEAVLGDGRVLLSWSPPADDGGSEVIKYQVLRGEPGGAMVVIDEVTTGTIFIDEDLTAGVVYRYSVAAVNVVGPGTQAPTVELKAVVRPGSPLELSVKVRDGSVLISWSSPGSDGGSMLTGYLVLRGQNKQSLSAIADVGTVTSHTDKAVEDGTDYWYSVVAVNAVGEGEATPPVKAKVPTTAEGPGGAPLWLLALIIILIILAIVVVMKLLQGPVTREDEEPEGYEPEEELEGEVADEEEAPPEEDDR